jgi:hypothetical protein
MGNFYNRIDTKINRKFLKLTNEDFFVKPLNNELAIEKGVEFFYEMIIYMILLGFPIYEMMRANKESEVKTKA